jgi:hypothetical protein
MNGQHDFRKLNAFLFTIIVNNTVILILDYFPGAVSRRRYCGFSFASTYYLNA